MLGVKGIEVSMKYEVEKLMGRLVNNRYVEEGEADERQAVGGVREGKVREITVS